MGDVHGESPKAVGKGYNFWYSLLFFELLAAGVCALLGLSFDPETVAGAWYVLAVLAAIILVNVLPYWLAREPEPPVVIPIECTS